jgi:hypothetical protein
MSPAHAEFHERAFTAFKAGRIEAKKFNHLRWQRVRTRLDNRLRPRNASHWPEAGITLAFSPPLEAAFQADLTPLLRRYQRDWADLPDAFRDRGRRHWRAFKLDKTGATAERIWQLRVEALLINLSGYERRFPERIPPEGYEHAPDDGGAGALWMIKIDARAPASSRRRLRPAGKPELEHAERLVAAARKWAARPPCPPWIVNGRFAKGIPQRWPRRPQVAGLNVPAFLQEHAAALREHLARCAGDPDQERALAQAYHGHLAGTPAGQRAWIEFLRKLRG